MWSCVLHVPDAPKGLQVMHHRILPVPSLERRHARHTLGWTPVQNVDGCVHRLTPKPSRQTFCLEHASCRCHHGAVVPFHNSILLQAVGSSELHPNPFSCAILREFDRGEFATTVSPEHTQFQA